MSTTDDAIHVDASTLDAQSQRDFEREYQAQLADALARTQEMRDEMIALAARMEASEKAMSEAVSNMQAVEQTHAQRLQRGGKLSRADYGFIVGAFAFVSGVGAIYSLPHAVLAFGALLLAVVLFAPVVREVKRTREQA